MVMALLVISADHNNTGASKHPRHGLVYVHVQVIWCRFSYFIITIHFIQYPSQSTYFEPDHSDWEGSYIWLAIGLQTQQGLTKCSTTSAGSEGGFNQ